MKRLDCCGHGHSEGWTFQLMFSWMIFLNCWTFCNCRGRCQQCQEIRSWLSETRTSDQIQHINRLVRRNPVENYIPNSTNYYHWRELPQAEFLSRQKFCCDKHVFCHDKSMLAATKLLSWQNCLSWQKFCCNTNICHDKHVFVATSILLLRQKTCFVMTNACLSQQNFCHDKNDTCGMVSQI